MLTLLADLILVTHVLFVAFVILGLCSIALGYYLRWQWVRNPWFRSAHLLAIVFVMTESLLGWICPLTEWESMARVATGGEAYSASFIRYWLHELLFYDFEPWVFAVAYTVSAVLATVAWILVPPQVKRDR